MGSLIFIAAEQYKTSHLVTTTWHSRGVLIDSESRSHHAICACVTNDCWNHLCEVCVIAAAVLRCASVIGLFACLLVMHICYSYH